MTELKNHQFEILPSAEALDGFVFGVGASVSVDEEGFDPGESDWFVQDADNQRRGTRKFGRDIPSPKTWTWSSHVNRDTVHQAVDTLEAFEFAWSPESVRDPDEILAVRYKVAERVRRVFGRPRRFAAPPSNLILNGYVPVTHDFALVDAYTYDDVEQSAAIKYTSGASGGGMTFPVTFPVTTMPSDGDGGAQITIGGNMRCYPIIRFTGPWTNPSLATEDWTLTWNGSIPEGGWVEIDLRPWKLTVLNHSGASVAEGIAFRSRLEDYWFAAQSQPQISLSGSGASGGAGATVRWRNTWKSF